MAASKAQTEIIGLLVIVIILVFLGLIYIGFSFIKQDSILPSVRTNIDVTNTLNALMKVSIGPTGETVEEFLVLCSSDPAACQSLENALDKALTATLKPNQAYTFTGMVDEQEIITFGSCERGVVSSYSFIKNTQFYETTLKLCAAS